MLKRISLAEAANCFLSMRAHLILPVILVVEDKEAIGSIVSLAVLEAVIHCKGGGIAPGVLPLELLKLTSLNEDDSAVLS